MDKLFGLIVSGTIRAKNKKDAEKKFDNNEWSDIYEITFFDEDENDE